MLNSWTSLLSLLKVDCWLKADRQSRWEDFRHPQGLAVNVDHGWDFLYISLVPCDAKAWSHPSWFVGMVESVSDRGSGVGGDSFEESTSSPTRRWQVLVDPEIAKWPCHRSHLSKDNGADWRDRRRVFDSLDEDVDDNDDCEQVLGWDRATVVGECRPVDGNELIPASIPWGWL